ATNCKAAFLREAYRRLTGDSTAADSTNEAEVDSRIARILDEEDPQLIWDLRGHNQGRSEEYEVFLQHCQNYIHTSVETAVDERRHDTIADDDVVTHLATALSVRDLHEEVCKQCPDGTKVPSIQWLRLQFWPRKPTAKTAARYTGRLKVKFMVQARQFRSNHVAAVERGKSVLAALGKRLTVADHDFTRLSMTPSVSLLIDVPDSIEGSFHRGKVFVILKENAFQPSSPIRHMTELQHLLTQLGPVKPIVVLYTDGGPDHRLTYLSVQLSLLEIFLELDLDFLCAFRTPPQHSWKNPVERIMSILNLALQGVGCMREEVEHEAQLKRCGTPREICPRTCRTTP
ncbi:hypothetical protein SKAU_G00061340, partial [Synaphobranchus kaupii]